MFHKNFTLLSSQIDKFFALRQVQQLKQKHPSLIGFLQERLGMQNFFGLPFTALLAVLIANLSMLTELSEHIVNSDGMKAMDSGVSGFLFDMRIDTLSNALYYFTQLGSVTGMAVMACLALGVLLVNKKWYYSIALIVSVLGNGLSTYLTKTYFHRERPLDIGYYDLSTFSFPSGHASGSVSLVGMLCVLVYLDRDSIPRSSLWVALGLFYILLIGFSRIYLGVHFITDIAGGYLLGSLWVIAALVMLEYLMLRKQSVLNGLEQ